METLYGGGALPFNVSEVTSPGDKGMAHGMDFPWYDQSRCFAIETKSPDPGNFSAVSLQED